MTDLSTEQKIKEAARIVFLQKGYAATKTRDIAEAADINLALLNYYFRSKKKLFDIIMFESLQSFLGIILKVLNNPDTSITEKLVVAVDKYIDMFKLNPNIPIFVFSEIRENPSEFINSLKIKEELFNTFFVKQMQEKMTAGNIPKVNPIHILMNIPAMISFPFMASPLLLELTGMERDDFNSLMDERKKLIPQWVEMMLQEKH